MSALSDRIKIARKAQGIDIQLSVQHLMNCGTAGTCDGGEPNLAYQWIKNISDATGSGISYTTGQPYMACSHDVKDGFCADTDFTCNPLNVQRTCGTFGEKCVGLNHYPNATVKAYGSIKGKDAMMKEIYNRGPIACNVDAVPILNYTGGIVTAKSNQTDHTISVVGWGTDSTEGLYWIVRNSWGEYWVSRATSASRVGLSTWRRTVVLGPCPEISQRQRGTISTTAMKMARTVTLRETALS